MCMLHGGNIEVWLHECMEYGGMEQIVVWRYGSMRHGNINVWRYGSMAVWRRCVGETVCDMYIYRYNTRVCVCVEVCVKNETV